MRFLVVALALSSSLPAACQTQPIEVPDSDQLVKSFEMPAFLTEPVKLPWKPTDELGTKRLQRYELAKQALEGRIGSFLFGGDSALQVVAAFSLVQQSGEALGPLGLNLQQHFADMEKLALKLADLSMRRQAIGKGSGMESRLFLALAWESKRLPGYDYEGWNPAEALRPKLVEFDHFGHSDIVAASDSAFARYMTGHVTLNELLAIEERYVNSVQAIALRSLESRRRAGAVKKPDEEQINERIPKDNPFGRTIRVAEWLEKHLTRRLEIGTASQGEVLTAKCHRLLVQTAIARMGQKPEEVKRLQRERLVSLEQLVGPIRDAYKLGRAGLPEVSANEERMARAKVELADSDADKEKLLREILRIATLNEALFVDRVDAGSGRSIDVVSAKARKLSVEIELLQMTKPQAKK
jgi:hypothetical protein